MRRPSTWVAPTSDDTAKPPSPMVSETQMQSDLDSVARCVLSLSFGRPRYRARAGRRRQPR